MSQADDILFSPIQSPVDFLTRCSGLGYRYTYDWKPMTERARQWCDKHFAPYVVVDGWLCDFGVTPGPIEAGRDVYGFMFGDKWNQELLLDNYTFASV